MSALNLVTGANGHLGNNLVRALLRSGQAVRCSVRNPSNTLPFRGLDCDIVKADLLDKASLRRALNGVETLYQVAAVYKHWARDPQKEIIEPNLVGTRNVLEIAAETGVRRVVYVSSEGALDDRLPSVNETNWRTDARGNPYFQSKTDSERLALHLLSELGLDLVTVLPGAIVGPNCFRLTPTMQLLQQARNHEIFIDVNFFFNFVDVRDVSEGIIAAARTGEKGERYLLSNERAISTRRLLELAKETDSSIKLPPRIPQSVLLAVASVMKLAAKVTHKEPLLLPSQVKIFYGNDRHMDITKARNELGYNPRDPEVAIREAFDYLRSTY